MPLTTRFGEHVIVRFAVPAVTFIVMTLVPFVENDFTNPLYVSVDSALDIPVAFHVNVGVTGGLLTVALQTTFVFLYTL